MSSQRTDLEIFAKEPSEMADSAISDDWAILDTDRLGLPPEEGRKTPAQRSLEAKSASSSKPEKGGLLSLGLEVMSSSSGSSAVPLVGHFQIWWYSEPSAWPHLLQVASVRRPAVNFRSAGQRNPLQSVSNMP